MNSLVRSSPLRKTRMKRLVPRPTIAHLDALARRYCRLRDKSTCQYCGTSYPDGGRGIQWCHFLGRRAAPAVRWDPENFCNLCTGHHRILDAHPLKKVAFWQKRFDRGVVDRLTIRANVSKVDRWMVKLSLEVAIREMEAEGVDA